MFTADRRVSVRTLLITGGSGMAPVRALLEELPARRRRRLPRPRGGPGVPRRARLARPGTWRPRHLHLGARDDPGPRHLFTPRGLRELVPDVRRRDVYRCGPPAWSTLHSRRCAGCTRPSDRSISTRSNSDPGEPRGFQYFVATPARSGVLMARRGPKRRLERVHVTDLLACRQPLSRPRRGRGQSGQLKSGVRGYQGKLRLAGSCRPPPRWGYNKP
jgi:hypothetical protein